MTKRNAFTLLITAVCALVIGTFWIQKGFAVWPFENNKGELAAILGPEATSWLNDAEVQAWTPDLNHKPQSFFIVQAMSETEFEAWAKAAKLRVSEKRSVPPSIFGLPDGIKFNRWVRPADAATQERDAQGSTDRAAIWSRWQGGITYTVLHPTY